MASGYGFLEYDGPALESIELSLHYCPALPVGLKRDQLARAARSQIVGKLEMVGGVKSGKTPEAFPASATHPVSCFVGHSFEEG